MKLNELSVTEFQAKLDLIDFTFVRLKLTHVEHGLGWSHEKVSLAEKQYRQHLTLQFMFASETPLVPTKLADQYWHQHILDTRQYARDCETLFGRFLHHFPYFGLRGADDARALAEASANTKALTLQFFPTTETDFADCSGTSCSSCQSCSEQG